MGYQFDYIHRDEASDYIRVSRDIQASQLPGSLPELPTMQLRREGKLDRFGKFILLNKEVQTL